MLEFGRIVKMCIICSCCCLKGWSLIFIMFDKDFSPLLSEWLVCCRNSRRMAVVSEAITAIFTEILMVFIVAV